VTGFMLSDGGCLAYPTCWRRASSKVALCACSGWRSAAAAASVACSSARRACRACPRTPHDCHFHAHPSIRTLAHTTLRRPVSLALVRA
jgi:hypothetical protein